MSNYPDFFFGLDRLADEQEKRVLQEALDDSLYFKVKGVNNEVYSLSSDGTGGLLRFQQQCIPSLAIAEDASLAVGITDVAAVGIPDDVGRRGTN
jgi:hypothetical protein